MLSSNWVKGNKHRETTSFFANSLIKGIKVDVPFWSLKDQSYLPNPSSIQAPQARNQFLEMGVESKIWLHLSWPHVFRTRNQHFKQDQTSKSEALIKWRPNISTSGLSSAIISQNMPVRTFIQQDFGCQNCSQRLPGTPNFMPQHAPYDTNHLISCLRHTWPWINFKPPKPTRALYLQNKVWMVKYRQVSSGRACQFNPIVKPKLLVWLLVFFSSRSLIIHRA